jgi:hypothetical protein
MDKNKTKAGRRALVEAAARFRMEAARTRDAPADASPDWDCIRGHAWDDTLGAAQNVRCMNCAAQRRDMQMARLEAVAEARGGRFLSANYVDATAPLRWQCAFGHEWQARADVASRRWCEQCVRCGVYDDAFPYQAREPEREVGC